MDLNIWIEYSKQIDKASKLTWENIEKNEISDKEEQQNLLRDSVKEVNAKFQQAHQEISMDDIEDVASILPVLAWESEDEELKTYIGLFFFLNQNKEGSSAIKIKEFSLNIRLPNDVKENCKCRYTLSAIEDFADLFKYNKVVDDAIIDKRTFLMKEYLDFISKSGIISHTNKDVININDTANISFVCDILYKLLFIITNIFDSCIQKCEKKKIIYNNNELKD